MYIEEQERVLQNDKKNMIVSASAGSGKTYILIKYICKLVVEDKIPLNKFLILTFTKAAAGEMKERLLKRLKQEEPTQYILDQIDALSVSNISTIHSFCEKNLKKYANLLKLRDNFEICEENQALKYKCQALKSALKIFKTQYEEEFSYINLNDDKLKQAIFDIENMMSAVADKDLFVQKVLTEQPQIYNTALKIICDDIDFQIESACKTIEEMHLLDLRSLLAPVLSADSLTEKQIKIKDFVFPKLPKKGEVSELELEKLKSLKTDLKKYFSKILSLELDDDLEKTGKVEIALMRLFLCYEKEYKRLKKMKNVLDFSDLEQNMLKLSNEDIFDEHFSYIFVDEYQDTNKLQEFILKRLARNSNFVAVGDAKQGIYGFRLASSDIFLKDVKTFQDDDNSNAVFLTSNFRSSQNLLQFINTIFEKNMTTDSAKIDYLNTAMLSGKKQFKDDGYPAVTIDVVLPSKQEEKTFELYNLKEDELKEQSSLLSMQTIKYRIEECLKSKIYDPDLQDFRPVEYKDIAILSRSRNDFFNQLGKFLGESGIPVTANGRNMLLENAEIKILINILKFILCEDDEIALVSIMMSNFGRFSQMDMLNLKNQYQNSFCEIYKIDNSGKMGKLRKLLSKFKLTSQSCGVKDAFIWLFAQTNYYTYLFKIDRNLKSMVNQFLSEIEGYNYDIPNLISYLDSVEIESFSATDEDSVLLTTIHKSKGLEYPIVFLINTGKSLKRSERPSDVKLDEELGVTIKKIDEESESASVKLMATELKLSRKRFAEEMMIFYVALTRAKNRLYIIGEKNNLNLKQNNLYKFDSYFDYIFSIFSEQEIEKLIAQEKLEKGSIFIDIVTDYEELKENKGTEILGKIDENYKKNIENYLNFDYLYKNEENIKLKNSVTELTKKYETQSVFVQNNDFVKIDDVIERGNAYHLALKVIDFQKINSLEDLSLSLNGLDETTKSYLDKNLLFADIQTLKNKTNNGRIFKEKEFIMKDKLCNMLDTTLSEEQVMVQGVVDLFVLKEDKSAILIDYKFSSLSEEKLIEKYKNQLKLYKNAIKNAFKVENFEVYLMNLKFNKLINVKNI